MVRESAFMNSSGFRKNFLAGKKYWRSLNELAESAEFKNFLEREFPSLADEDLSSSTRREFLRLMGASLALMGITIGELTLSGCRWPREKIVPYVKRPEGKAPGVPVQYATAMEVAGVATGVLVTSYDGRPIKVEGNPSHPFSMGAASAVAQASLLELYDPDRSKFPLQKEKNWELTKSWTEFHQFCVGHFASLRGKGGEGFYILSEASSSPSLQLMKGKLQKAFPKAVWLEYEPISRDNERTGTKLATGVALRSHLHLDKARVILSLDSDFLMTHPASIRYSFDFAKWRRGEASAMNRLYVVESGYSVTGACADHRLPLSNNEILAFCFALARELEAMGARMTLGASEFASPQLSQAIQGADIQFLRALAKDLFIHSGSSVVTAGFRLPPEIHALVLLINDALGNVGKTITYTAEPDQERQTHLEAISQLAQDIGEGKVKTLLILGGNPAYDAPSDLAFDELLGDIETTIHLSLYRNETSKLCAWHLPRAHYLESWGDARAYDGTVSVIQPLIEPLYGGKTPIEVLSYVLNEEPFSGYQIVKRSFANYEGSENSEEAWRKALDDGFVPATAWSPLAPNIDAERLRSSLNKFASNYKIAERGEFELVFAQSHFIYDGRFANNGWLQELPDPITKLVWDNALLISPNTAKLFGFKDGDIAHLTANGKAISVPVLILPGVASSTLILSLGYGREDAGRVGTKVGVNAYTLRTTSAWDISRGAILVKTAKNYKLATTQDHHAIDILGFAERGKRVGSLIRELTFAELKEAGEKLEEIQGEHPPSSLWTEHKYEGHKWGMAIDLSVCTGCSACVIACQAENNVPIVGKKQVLRGREMHWIRIDRYFSGDIDNPQVRFQPLTCHHCENAPCEQVCPVAATVHSAEGLNEMVYNRCIGTRYCSNNCPYKVRRFNFFNYHKGLAESEKMLFNPEVTVRSRGVMEKCSFCVQRIEQAKIKAKNENRELSDGEIVPACAQTCPTNAIVFGDLNDPESKVRELAENKRAYQILAELNVKPRTSYLAKLKNPNEELA